MMILCDEKVDEHFELTFFKSVWGRLGYVLASSLVSRELSGASDAQLLSERNK
jgi:hypothetical protein